MKPGVSDAQRARDKDECLLSSHETMAGIQSPRRAREPGRLPPMHGEPRLPAQGDSEPAVGAGRTFALSRRMASTSGSALLIDRYGFAVPEV